MPLESEFPPLSPPVPEEGLSDEAQEKQTALKQEAVDALEDGKLDLALKKYTEAILCGCNSALLYSRRAKLLLQLDRPGACVNDCTAALALNPDSGSAYKLRGKAYVKMEKLEEAHKDFSTGLKLDYDEDTEEIAKPIAEKVKTIEAERTAKKKKEEEAEYHRQLLENKAKYEEGLKAREAEFREQREKEEYEKRKFKEDHKERVRAKRQREEEEEEAEMKKEGPPVPEPAPDDVEECD